jgi:hypothetical protein
VQAPHRTPCRIEPDTNERRFRAICESYQKFSERIDFSPGAKRLQRSQYIIAANEDVMAPSVL